MAFSQRYGFDSKKTFQKDSIDNDLRVGIWNVIYRDVMRRDIYICESNMFEEIWTDIFKKELDNFKGFGYSKFNLFKDEFMFIKWNKVYDIVELFIKYSENKIDLADKFNEVLIRENSAYRIVNCYVIPIIDDVELDEIEEVLNCEFDVVKNQIKNSLILLSDRENPDYKNSFKESISAVESLCKIILNNKTVTLGQALKQIEKDNDFEINGALKSAFSILYGFASNEARHGTIKESEIDFNLAKYMVVSCSAFINYLISKNNL